MKRIIVCCDGTWNAPDINNPKNNRPSNVLKMARAIKPLASNGATVQVIEYIPGVGTFNKLDRWFGGMTGYGLSKNICRAYDFIANNYTPGDKIYLFGFSRGAYTARSLCGFMNKVGIIEKDKMHLLPEVFKFYNDKRNRKLDKYDFREMLKNNDKTKDLWLYPEDIDVYPVHFLGVWDTVGSLGFPTPLLGKLSQHWIGFHNTDLAGNVTHAYQALALHELRRLFRPSLWTSKKNYQSVEQVWFPGAHSDVGGGLKEPNEPDLASCPLRWMAEKARNTGLELDWIYLNQFKYDNCQPFNESRQRFYKLYPIDIRKIGCVEGIEQSISDMYINRIASRCHQDYLNTLDKNILDSYREIDGNSKKLRQTTLNENICLGNLDIEGVVNDDPLAR